MDAGVATPKPPADISEAMTVITLLADVKYKKEELLKMPVRETEDGVLYIGDSPPPEHVIDFFFQEDASTTLALNWLIGPLRRPSDAGPPAPH